MDIVYPNQKNYQLFLNELAKGTYILKITVEKTTINIKIIKQ